MEGFFDRADTIAEAMASAFAATAQGAPAKTLIPLFELISVEESTQVEKFVTGESPLIPAEIPTPQKGVTPAEASQIESISPATPLVIFVSNLFIASFRP